MRHYPLSRQLAAFVERTLSFTSPDNSSQGLRDNYSRMCRAFTPPRPEGLRISELQLAGVPARAYCP
ncbi:lipase, partial [Pseudomonas sp. GW456-L14]